MAQTALHDAIFVSKNIKRHLAGDAPHPYEPKTPIYVTPVGPLWAAVLWGKIQLYGWLGWAIRQLADFVALHDIEPLLPASEQWLNEFTEQEDCLECAKTFSD
jgi:NADH dehydrogenase FAD-containing subunit